MLPASESHVHPYVRRHRQTRSLPTIIEPLLFSCRAANLRCTIMQPPSLEERDHYYEGLPSRPRLVARSSVTPWRGAIPPERLRYHQKRLAHVGNHPVVEAWNGSAAEGSLRASVLDALSGTDWTAVDILRVGYADDSPMPVVLMISVNPNAVLFKDGSAIVRRCKQLLDGVGLHGVECEIRESEVSNLLASSSAPPLLPQLSHFTPARLTFRPDRDVSDRIRTCIASYDSLAVEGTKCLYLAVKREGQDRETIAVLTCRHVAVAMDHDEQKDCCLGTTTSKKLVQVGKTTFSKHFAMLQNMVQYYNDRISATEARRDILLSTPEESEASLRKLHNDRAPYQASLDRLRLMEEPSSRVFGHLLYARSYGIREGSGKDGWLSDWALFELHQEKFKQPLSSLTNQILMDSLPSETTDLAYAMQPDADREMFEKGVELSLSGIIAETSMVNPPDMGLCHESGLVVAKLGGKSNLTLGCSNEVNSVTRRPFGDRKISEEWCIVSIDGEGKFSKPGDSGACVFDLNGRIGGMITSGNGKDSAQDITYATPMERLLRDIEASGFKVRVL
ncbi:hypothetical protein CDV31_016999 [Fusarium ambrosium]|uniref:Peptidase S1 domain-containing protein n=1 Tax=Fusarium ambrosium TaxID=131363 RepID=A0A428RW83_9HYPO|nr:hypothetical protein CDV31_016999 [Fusarium ambrosium]